STGLAPPCGGSRSQGACVMTKWTKSWDTLLFSAIALLIVLGLGGALLVRYLEPVNAELRRLQGDWELVRVQQDGKQINFALVAGTYRVRGDRVSIMSDKEEEYCRIEVNPRILPKEIDLIFQDKKRNREERIPGIYELGGDDLAVYLSRAPESESARPTEITGKNAFVAHFKRKK